MANTFVPTIARLFLVFVGVYFFELASFPLSIDEELAAFRTNPEVWVFQGRWGAYLLERFFLPNPTLPVVPVLIFGVALAVAYLLLLDLIQPGRQLETKDYVLFALFCGFPTWYFIVEFYSNIATVGIGTAACAASIWLAIRGPERLGSKASIAMSVALGAFAVSTYQSLLFLLIAFGCGVVLLRDVEDVDRISWRAIGRIVALACGTAAVYFAMNSVFRRILPGTSPYFDSVLQINNALADPVAAFVSTFATMGGVYGLSKAFYSGSMAATAVIILAGAVALVHAYRYRPSRGTIALVSGLVVLFVPFTLHPLGVLPHRSLIGVPFAVWLLARIGIGSASRYIAIVAWIAVSITIYQMLVLGNRYQAASYFVARHDLATAIALEERITHASGFDPKTAYAISVFGGLGFDTNYPRPRTSTVGRSFFEWDSGNPHRIVAYMRLLGFNNLRGAAESEQDKVIGKLKDMPVWPAADSVQIEDDVVLVRFSERPNASNLRSIAKLRPDTQ